MSPRFRHQLARQRRGRLEMWFRPIDTLPRVGRFLVVLQWLLFASVFGFLLVATLTMPKAIGWDAGEGILAARQYEAGVSPSYMRVVVANPENLAQDHSVKVSQRPPSYQAVPLSLVTLGLSWGQALNLVTFGCLLAGFAGWTWYFRMFTSSWSLIGLWLLSMVASNSIQETATQYNGGDLLLWTSVPLLLYVNMAAVRSRDLRSGLILAYVAGVGATTIYLVKYSGILLGLGLLLAWILELRRSHDVLRFGAWILGAASGVALVLTSGVVGGPTPASNVAGHSHFSFLEGILALCGWPTEMTDLASPLLWAAYKFELPVLLQGTGLLLLAVLLALVVIQRHRFKAGAFDRYRQLLTFTVIVAVIDTVLYAGLVAKGLGFDPRLTRLSGLIFLPPVSLLLLHSCRRGPIVGKVAATAILFSLFAVPPVFGVVRSIRKMSLLAPVRAVIANDEYVTNLPARKPLDLRRFYAELRYHVPSPATVIYVIHPNLLFPIPTQRCLISLAGIKTTEELCKMRYTGVPQGGVALLLPTAYEENGKLAAIQSSFVDVKSWTQVRLRESSEWGLWISK